MTIMESTIIPFYERVENCNETSLAKLSIPQREFQLSYQAIFHLCGQCSEEDYSQKFYLKHTQLLEDYCESAIINHLYQTPSLKGSSQLFLIDWVECWRKYCWVVDGLQRDRYYVKNGENIQSLGQKGFTIFAQKVFKMFGLKLRDSVLGYLQEERFKGKQSTRHLVKQSIATVVYLEQKAELPLYREYIETPLLEASKRFFEVCGKSLLENEKCSNDFLEKVEILYKNEKERTEELFAEQSVNLLLDLLLDELMTLHFDQFFQDNQTKITELFTNNSFDELSLAYRLYKRQTNTQNGLNILSLSYSLSLRKKLFEYTSENEINPPLRPQKLNPKKRLKTEKIAKNTTNPVQNPVTNTVDTYKPNTKTSAETSLRQRESIFHALNVLAAEKRTVRFVFNNERLFEAALHREAERFLNRQGRFAAALALFLNALFVTDDNARPPLRYSDCLRGFEGELSAAVELVRYVREPELFEKILLALLAEGHLTANIKAPDAAATLLRKLVDAQKTLGGRVTGEPAANWAEISASLAEELKSAESLSGEWSELHPSAVLRPKVCAANCWPAMPPADLTLPPSLLRQCAAFVDFYGAKHPRRALLWRLELGRAELRVRFSAQNERAVSATTVQMLALLAFNGGRGAVSFEEMRSRAAAPAALLRWHLSFLCAGPSPVLRRVACPEAACPLVGAEFYSLNPDYGGTAEAHEGPVVAAAVRFPPFFREHFDLFSDESFFSSQVQDKIRENDKNAKIRENALLFSDLFSVEEVNKMRRRKKQGEKMRSLQKPKAHSDNSESDGEDEAIALRSGRRVAAGGLRSSSEESSSDRANGREMAIDAAVVRILKREGPKSDAELFAAVKGELRRSSAVRVTMDEIAARVRDLAAKEFVRFDQERGVVSFLP